jgi:hypothetical protein
VTGRTGAGAGLTLRKPAQAGGPKPLLSIILLDWSVREHFHVLDWLNNQNVDRALYELIWVEAHDRVVEQVTPKVDQHLLCHQQGLYHKHAAWNAAALHARGTLVTFSDSDAVYPPDFVKSVLESFGCLDRGTPAELVLMHHEWRTRSTYPGGITRMEQLAQFEWLPLWPNVGACMTVRMEDFLRYGGLDEHESYRGYMCGPYELGWRMVNAGLPERWHDPAVALWHFAHPDPPNTLGQRFSFKLWSEMRHPHINGHALSAVEALSTGRISPLLENEDIWTLRMSRRSIGTPFEEEYAHRCGRGGFAPMARAGLWLRFFWELFKTTMRGIPPVRAAYRLARRTLCGS